MMPAVDQRRRPVPDMLSVLGDFESSLRSNSCQHNSEEERTAIISGLDKQTEMIMLPWAINEEYPSKEKRNANGTNQVNVSCKNNDDNIICDN